MEPPDSEPRRAGLQDMQEELQAVLASGIFARSSRQAKFLNYVCERVFLGEPEQIKEYTIAVEVLGRSPDFDQNDDSIVRVEAHRLRKKLAKYYETEGADHQTRIFIETGQYIPQFIDRQQIVDGNNEPVPPTDSEPQPPEEITAGHTPEASDGTPTGRPDSLSRLSRRVVLAGSAVLLLAGGIVIGWAVHAGSPTGIKPDLSDPVTAFWTSFLGGDKEPVIIFSGSMFLNTDFGDLLKLRVGGASADRGAVANDEVAKHDLVNPTLLGKVGTLGYEDGYTGTGEMYGSFRICTVLTRLGVNATAKRSRVAGVFDLRSHSTIFLGAVSQNPTLAEVAQPDDFVFERPREPPYLWRSCIHNKHPLPGETEFFRVERDPTTQVLKADYAIFSVLPGIVPNHKIMVLTGISTSGTQGAAEFVCSSAGISSLQKKLRFAGKLPDYFQGVLRVETSRGLDATQIRLVAARTVQHGDQ